MSAPRGRRAAAVVLAGTVALASSAGLVPPFRARFKALAVLARSVGLPLPRPLAARVTVRRVRVAADLTGDLYWPGGPAPAIVIAPGGTPLGSRDPRVIRVARSLAGAHRVVFVADLALVRQTFVWADERRLVEAAGGLRRSLRRSVGLLGFSYGGSFCLLAAEDPRAGPLSFVAAFGAFGRVLDVVQGVTTGATTVDGRTVAWKTVPEARGILTGAALRLTPPPDRGPLEAALRTGHPAALSPGARAVFDLLTNHDPARTAPLAAGLPPAFRAALTRFSPLTRANLVRAPVFLMQSLNDPATPPTEAGLLHRSLPASRLVLLEAFLHVNPPGRGTPVTSVAADLWGAWEFTSWILAAQE